MSKLSQTENATLHTNHAQEGGKGGGGGGGEVNVVD